MAAEAAAAAAAVDEVFRLFAEQGESDYVGEAVSQLQHAVQCAHHASAAGAEPAVVAGALLHDVGHMLGLRFPGRYERMGDCGVMAHEGVGGAWLADLGFPGTTADVVRLHVEAKRYRCWKDPVRVGRWTCCDANPAVRPGRWTQVTLVRLRALVSRPCARPPLPLPGRPTTTLCRPRAARR